MRTAQETRALAWRTLAEDGCYGSFMLGMLLLVFLGALAFSTESFFESLGFAQIGIAELTSRIMKAGDFLYDGRLPQFDQLDRDIVELALKLVYAPAKLVAALGVVAAATLWNMYFKAFDAWGKNAMSIAAVRRGLRVAHSISGWGYGWRMAWLRLRMRVLVFLQLLLFIVPGVVAYFSYAMAPYLMIDHPDWSARRCMEESTRLMEGRRWRFFCLCLSFIGWVLLVVLVLLYVKVLAGLAILMLVPYMNVAYAHFYEELLDADCQRTPSDASTETPPLDEPPAREH